MLEELKKRVCEQNLALVRHGLVVLTWGNVSGIDREKGLVVIKPSGVDYASLKPEDMTVVDTDGRIIEGRYRPSSDTPTHLYLYKAFPSVGGVVHTHSRAATAFAQAGRAIPALGTTHADAFYGDVPCTRPLSADEINGDYEANTGAVIAGTFAGRDFAAVPACLVYKHGPFVWGPTPEKATENAVTLEAVAEMALCTFALDREAARAEQTLLDRHYFRKHGAGAYYGQTKTD